MKKILIIFLLLSLLFASYISPDGIKKDYQAFKNELWSKRVACSNAWNHYYDSYMAYNSFMFNCDENASMGYDLCLLSEKEKRYNALVNEQKEVGDKCFVVCNMAKDKYNKLKAKYESECQDITVDNADYCHELFEEYDELGQTLYENLWLDGWVAVKYTCDNNNDGIVDWINDEDVVATECAGAGRPCDYFEDDTGNKKEEIEINIVAPQQTVYYDQGKNLYVNIKASVSGNPSDVQAYFIMQNPLVAVSGPMALHKGYWEYTAMIDADKLKEGNAKIEVEASKGSTKQSKSITISLKKKEETNENNKTTEQKKTIEDVKNALQDCCSSKLFEGIKAKMSSEEALSTEQRITNIANAKNLKISFVNTPYGKASVIEKNVEGKDMLSYKQKKIIVKGSNYVVGKILQVIKEKLGIPFGDKFLNYFINKGTENAVYNDKDKVEKTKEELGVSGKSAKLFNDVVDTNKRDWYKASSEEAPDNIAVKQAKEMLNQLERFHDRAAAGGIRYEYEMAKQTAKLTVKGRSKEWIQKNKETIKRLIKMNLEDIEQTTYHGGGVFSSGRFINVLGKDKGKYNMKDIDGRAEYYFDLLWNSGEVYKLGGEGQ